MHRKGNNFSQERKDEDWTDWQDQGALQCPTKALLWHSCFTQGIVINGALFPFQSMSLSISYTDGAQLKQNPAFQTKKHRRPKFLTYCFLKWICWASCVPVISLDVVFQGNSNSWANWSELVGADQEQLKHINTPTSYSKPSLIEGSRRPLEVGPKGGNSQLPRLGWIIIGLRCVVAVSVTIHCWCCKLWLGGKNETSLYNILEWSSPSIALISTLIPWINIKYISMFTQIYLLSILGDVFMLLSCRTSSWPRLEYFAVHRLQMAVTLFLSKDIKPLSKACSCALQSGLWEVRAQLVSCFARTKISWECWRSIFGDDQSVWRGWSFWHFFCFFHFFFCQHWYLGVFVLLCKIPSMNGCVTSGLTLCYRLF